MKKKIRFVNSGIKVPINKEYIKEIFDKYGYKRENDPLVIEMKKIFKFIK